MAGFTNISRYAASFAAGRTLNSFFRKAPSQASVANWWVDLSMSSGFPSPNYYTGTSLTLSTLNPYDGIYHGANKSPSSKHLADIGVCGNIAGFNGHLRLLDYVGFYPTIDLDTTDAQPLSNPAPLTRYADGAGVQVMIVATYPTVGGGTFTFDYINQSGVAKTSPVHTYATAASNYGTILTGEPSTAAGGMPFCRLAPGDSGVQAITSWNNIAVTGGVGAAVLVKPLAHIVTKETAVPSEMTSIRHMPGAAEIKDGAYLNWIIKCGGTVAGGLLSGYLTTVWSE